MAATPESETNKRITRRFPEEVATEGNVDLVDELCTEDVIDHSPDGEIRGREALKAHMNAYLSAFGDFSATVEEAVAEGDTVAMRVTLRGVHEGEFVNVPPTGNEFEVANMVFTRIEDGQIAERRVQPDMLGLFEQLGIVELPRG